MAKCQQVLDVGGRHLGDLTGTLLAFPPLNLFILASGWGGGGSISIRWVIKARPGEIPSSCEARRVV